MLRNPKGLAELSPDPSRDAPLTRFGGILCPTTIGACSRRAMIGWLKARREKVQRWHCGTKSFDLKTSRPKPPDAKIPKIPRDCRFLASGSRLECFVPRKSRVRNNRPSRDTEKDSPPPCTRFRLIRAARVLTINRRLAHASGGERNRRSSEPRRLRPAKPIF